MPTLPQRAASMTEPAPVTWGSAAAGRAQRPAGRQSRICTKSCKSSPTTAGGSVGGPSLQLSSKSARAGTRSPARQERGRVRRAARASGGRRMQAGKGRAGSPPDPLSRTPTAPEGAAQEPPLSPQKLRPSLRSLTYISTQITRYWCAQAERCAVYTAGSHSARS